MSKRSPGPWSASPGVDDRSNECIDIRDVNGRMVAQVHDWRETEGNMEDNGSLLAAADDLLAICEEIANDSRVDLVDSELRIRLYSAIKKAKGEF